MSGGIRGNEQRSAVREAVDRLQAAARYRTPCSPVRSLFAPDDVGAAYEVQAGLTDLAVREGRRVVGRKIGLTSPAVQRQLGVDQPDFGALFADMDCRPDEPIDYGRLLQPKAEAEVAFVLAEDLDDDELTPETVRAAVGYAVAALEIVDSRVRDWDISIVDTVADNASSGVFVLGSTRVPLDDLDLPGITMVMTKNGAEASIGMGANCLGDPLNALLWLAETTRRYGAPLRAGDLVLSGALGPMVSVEPGTSIRADLTSLGSVSATFTTQESQ